VSRERARQLEVRAKGKLRALLGSDLPGNDLRSTDLRSGDAAGSGDFAGITKRCA
jgi:hypothetical protein